MFQNKFNSNIKSISHHKFNRMMLWGNVKRGIAYYTLPNSPWTCKVSLEAFMLGDFLYMRIPTKAQDKDLLKTVCIRIDRYYGKDKYLTAFVENQSLYSPF